MSETLSKSQLTSILTFDPSIRYVMLVGQQGQSLARIDKPGASTLEPPAETAVILQRFAIARGMTMGSSSFYGEMHTIIVRREKLVELLFPLASQMVLVGAESSFPLEKTPQLGSLIEMQGAKK
jgi:hypothetical protein